MSANVYLYNVYDGGKLVLSNARASAIGEALGIHRQYVNRFARTGHLLDGRYMIDYAEGYGYTPKDTEACKPEKTEGGEFIRRYGLENYKQWQELNRRYGRKKEGYDE